MHIVMGLFSWLPICKQRSLWNVARNVLFLANCLRSASSYRQQLSIIGERMTCLLVLVSSSLLGLVLLASGDSENIQSKIFPSRSTVIDRAHTDTRHSEWTSDIRCGNSADKLRHPRSVAYSVQLVFIIIIIIFFIENWQNAVSHTDEITK